MIENLRGFSNGAMAYEGWIHVSSIEEANDKITAFETTTTSRFCCVRADKDFGRTDNIFFLMSGKIGTAADGCL